MQGRTTKQKTNQVQVEAGKPHCPSWLDKYAKNEWKRVLPMLERQNTLAKIDGTILANYCVAYSFWRQSVERVEEEGIKIKLPNGYTQSNPSLKDARDYSREMRDCMFALGMSPKARAELRTVKKPSGTSAKWAGAIPMAS